MTRRRSPLHAAGLSLVLGIFAAPLRAQSPEPQWVAVGPQMSTVLSLERDPFQPAVLLAGMYFGGVYRSVDYGHTWTPLAASFSERSVFSIAFDPSAQGVLYVGTFQAGLFKSTDGGTTWIATGTGLSDSSVQAVAVAPYDSRLVLAAGSDGGLFRSIDGGGTWTQAADGDRSLRGQTLVFDAQHPGSVYVATVGNGVFRSVDGGATWAPFNDGLVGSNALSLRIDRVTGTHLYAATDQGAFKLTIGQDVWQDITRNLPGFLLHDIIPHPILENFAFAATLTGVYLVTDDRSEGWTFWNALPTRLLAIDNSGSVVHAAVVHGGLWATSDFGSNWARVDAGVQNLFVGALAAIPYGSTPILFTGSDFGVHHTTPSGWVNVFDRNQAVFDIKTHPTDPSTLYLGAENGGVWKSADGGQSWTQSSNGIVPRQIHALAETSDGASAFAGTSSGLFISLDRGRSWRNTNTGTASIALSVATDPVRPPIVYVGGTAGQVYRSGDGGWTFFPASSGLPAENIVAFDIAPWGRTYAVTAGGALFSTGDDGANWQSTHDGITEAIAAVKTDPARPWVLYVGTQGGGVYKSESEGLTWTRLSDGLDLPFVFSLAVDPRDAQVIYAGSVGRVYRSSDGAAHWQLSAGSLPQGVVTALAIDPNNSGIVYASIAGAGVYRSADGGASWTATGTDLPPSDGPIAIAASRQADTVYAGGSLRGVFVSTDGGAHWLASSVGMTLFVRGIAIDPASPSTLYAGSLGAGVFKSVDAGASWSNVGLREGNIFKLAIDPHLTQRVYAATSQGVAVSQDAGATWQALGQKAPYVHAFVVDPRNRDVAYVGTTAGNLFRTADGGRTWTRANSTLPPLSILALAISPTGTLYASPERAGVYFSSDNGATWKRMDDAVVATQKVTALALDGSTVYAATSGGGVFKSTAGGPWTSASSGLSSPLVAHIVADRDQHGVMWASTYGGGIFRTTNAGDSWEWVGYGLTTGQVASVTVSASTPGLLYASTIDGVFRSTDGGHLWTAAGLTQTSTYAVTVDADAPGTLYAATNGKGVFKSTDGGTTWLPVNAGLTNLDVRSVERGAAPGALYAATLGAGVARSVDGGVTWGAATNSDLVDNFVLAIAADPGEPSTVYAGTAGQGVLKSTNGGIDWFTVNNGLRGTSVLSLAVDPQQTGTVYAGTAGDGVFATTDGGQNWRPANTGLFNHIVTALLVDPTDHRRVYAGTEGGGAFAAGMLLDPLACSYTVSPPIGQLSAAGGTLRVTVAAPAGCNWSAQPHAAWITVSGASGGTANGAVTIDIAPNVSFAARSGSVTAAGQTVAIVQTGLGTRYRLTVHITGRGAGTVVSDWPGIYCGADCVELFDDSLPVVLAPTPGAQSAFVGWSGDPDCADGRVVLSADRDCTARFEKTDDLDGDGLPDWWELEFGLRADSAVGDDGADGDPDGDGVTNAQEFANGTHPRGFYQRYFAFGSAAQDVQTTFDLFNPGSASTQVVMRFAATDGGWRLHYVLLPPLSRTTVAASDVAGLAGLEFGTIIESDQPIVADRSTTFGPGRIASSAERSADALSTHSYLVAGAAPPTGILRHDIFNPGSTPAAVQLTFVPPPPAAPIVKTYVLPPAGVLTVRPADEDSSLSHVPVWTEVRSSAPIAAEDSMTVDVGGQFGGSAAASIGIDQPALTVYLADGQTGDDFKTFIVLVNPNDTGATVTIQYLLPDGRSVLRSHSVAARAAVSIAMDAEDPLLASAQAAIVVRSTNGVPVLAQRTMWWPGPNDQWWLESHTSAATDQTGTLWAVADGQFAVTDWTQTFVAVANISAIAASVRIRLVMDDGTLVEKTYPMPAQSRLTVDVGRDFPSAAFHRFSVLAESVGSSPAQLVVEESTYSTVGDVVWPAGANLGATRLKP